MSAFNSKDKSSFEKSSEKQQQNQMSKISKKGTTLGAQHASHGDNGVEKMARKAKTDKK